MNLRNKFTQAVARQIASLVQFFPSVWGPIVDDFAKNTALSNEDYLLNLKKLAGSGTALRHVSSVMPMMVNQYSGPKVCSFR